MSLPAASVAGEGALSQLRRAAGPDAELPELDQPAPSSRLSGDVRFCAFAGDDVAVQGVLSAPDLRLNAVAAEDAGAPVPVVDRGVVDAASAAKARALLAEMLSQSPASVPAALKARRVLLVVVPRDKKLTDLPQFSSLRGVRLPDGRVWDDVRGVGFVAQDDGTVAVAAGEENFEEGASPDRYPKGFLLAHEFSHAVHGYGLAASDASAIRRAYAARESGHLEFPSRYASTNELEYFAVSASSFFGRTLSGKDPERPLSWIEANDAAMFEILGRAYGTPRPLWPSAPSLALRH